MARRKKVVETVETVEAVEAAAAPESGGGGSRQPALVLKIGADGRIEAGSMRQSTRDRLKAALAGSDILAPAAGGAEAGEALEGRKRAFSTVVPALYRVLGAIEGFLASKAAKIPYDDAARIMDYGEEEVAVLIDPTSAVLAKHLPDSAGWSDEITLALYLAAFHQRKVAALQEAAAAVIQAAPLAGQPAGQLASEPATVAGAELAEDIQ